MIQILCAQKNTLLTNQSAGRVLPMLLVVILLYINNSLIWRDNMLGYLSADIILIKMKNENWIIDPSPKWRPKIQIVRIS